MINVIDIFAGPGGLGEGFFSFKNKDNVFPFRALVSVEKDANAHATLTLRTFFRLLTKQKLQIPKEYFLYANGKASTPANKSTEHLWLQSQKECCLLELGKLPAEDKSFFNQIKSGLKERNKNAPSMLIGGPPCQAYSLVGRARNKGNLAYIAEEDHRHFLYKEYLSILDLFAPDIFVMENVKGLLSSVVGGGAVFDTIIKDLEQGGSGYKLFSLKTGKQFIRGESDPREFIIPCEEYGIPQNRHRVILLGLKQSSFSHLSKIPKLEKSAVVTVGDAISDLPELRSSLSNRGTRFKLDSQENWLNNLNEGIEELCKVSTFDIKLKEKLRHNLKRLENYDIISDKRYLAKTAANAAEYSKFVKDSLDNQITYHETRPHMDNDLLRYFYCATYRELFKRNPKAIDFPKYLAPAHKNWQSGKFVDRFKVQSFDSPSSTITSHISKDGHYFIHSDPLQCRSLTAREAARIQTFPDSYQFMGKRTHQLQQIGNAVPPLLAHKIAAIINKLL